MTWRKIPFERGAAYRVRESFDALRDRFSAGEILFYERAGYSRYDNATGYFFRDTRGNPRVWDVGDEEQIDAELFFQKTDPPPFDYANLSHADWFLLRDLVLSTTGECAAPMLPPHLAGHEIVSLVARFRASGEKASLDLAANRLAGGRPNAWLFLSKS